MQFNAMKPRKYPPDPRVVKTKLVLLGTTLLAALALLIRFAN